MTCDTKIMSYFAGCHGLISEGMKIITNWTDRLGVAGGGTVVEGGAGIKEGISRRCGWEQEHQ